MTFEAIRYDLIWVDLDYSFNQHSWFDLDYLIHSEEQFNYFRTFDAHFTIDCSLETFVYDHRSPFQRHSLHYEIADYCYLASLSANFACFEQLLVIAKAWIFILGDDDLEQYYLDQQLLNEGTINYESKVVTQFL